MIDIAPADFELLNAVQREFPLCRRQFALIAETLGRTETDVIDRLRELEDEGVISRFGAVFDHRSAGASTLAAMAVPADRIEPVAAAVSDYDSVNHNYLREHDYNLWFVVTGPDQAAVDGTLASMRAAFGLPLLDLPMEAAYHIDLGFRL